MIINDFSTLTLFWNHKNFFTEKNSLSRYYPEGKVKAQFAFPNSQQSNYLLLAFDKSVSPYTHQLAPSKTVDPEIINAVAYCIAKSE